MHLGITSDTLYFEGGVTVLNNLDFLCVCVCICILLAHINNACLDLFSAEAAGHFHSSTTAHMKKEKR